MSSADPTASDFAEVVGCRFVASSSLGEPLGVEFELTEVTRTEPSGGPRSDPFELFFHGPAAVGQGTYRLDHPTLGALAIFVVPIGSLPDGRVRYQAIFN